jgi:hypothetical protein
MTPRTIWGCGTAVLLLLGLVPAAWGYDSSPEVQDMIPDARAAALGGAFTSQAEGSGAVWWNPGGLGLMRDWWATPFSQSPTRSDFGLKFKAYGVCGPVGRGGAAVHFGRWEGRESGDPHWTQSALRFGYGVDLAELIRHRENSRLQWGVGASVKRLSLHYPGAARPSWENLSAWDADLGTLARLERPLPGIPALAIVDGHGSAQPSFIAARAGLMLRNALNRKIGPNKSPLGQELHSAVGLETGLIPTPPFGHLLQALATIEVDRSLTDRDVADNVKFGVETTLLGIVSWRYGESDDHYHFWVSSDEGVQVVSRNYRFVTHGIGLRLGTERLSVHVDYARTIRDGADSKLYTVSLRGRP